MASISTTTSSSNKETTSRKRELPICNPFTTILQVMPPPFTFNPHLLLFKPTSTTTTTTTTTTKVGPLQFLDNLHKSVTSNAIEFLHFLHNYPFFNKLLSFTFPLHHFSQVHYRNQKSSNFLGSHNFAAVLPGDSVAGVVVGNGIMNFLNLYNTLLVVRLVLTWFPNAPPQVVSPLSTLCDPYLNIFRGIIPPLGGTLDLSPILAFLVLNAFTSAAAALPAELPLAMPSHQVSPKPGLSELTTSQIKWQRRLQSKTSGTSDGSI